jgi:hypothetical protein
MRSGRIAWTGPRDQVDKDRLAESVLGLTEGVAE